MTQQKYKKNWNFTSFRGIYAIMDECKVTCKANGQSLMKM